MTESGVQKTRSTIEIGAVIGIVLFLITLSFNAGIQYNQITALNIRTDSNTAQIEKINTGDAAYGAMLQHIQTMVEDMRASQELRATGAGR